jgi:hypothetical protein
MRACAAFVLAASVSLAEAEAPCVAHGEPVQWVADYCMLKMETDDEIAVSDCIEDERKAQFPSACASNTYFKERMCEQVIRNGTRAGTVEQCINDPSFKGRTVAAGGVGAGREATAPRCEFEPGRQAERIQGEVGKGAKFSRLTPAGWIVRLAPVEEGWILQIAIRDHEAEDLSRFTPPWHFVPNPRQIEGWHFRNADNTGPNDGSVNAPQELRDFIFSPAVGRGIEYSGSATTEEEVAQIRSFGRGWLFIESYRLTPLRKGERAAFESLRFSACLTWPAGAPVSGGGRK